MSLTWHGTAGFTVESADRTVLIDPFVTRTPLHALVTQRLEPDEERIARVFPDADDVLIGHAHYDHVLDAPSICLRTGARLLGSRSACNVARAAGVPEAQIVETHGGHEIACGKGASVRALPSAHGRVYLDRAPLPGEITRPPPWPPRNRDLRHGLVLNWLLTFKAGRRALTILHIDSAEFFAEQLREVRADVVCLCAIGRNFRPRYLEEIVELTRPRFIVPCHWDWLFTPYEAEPLQLPGVDVKGFVREIEAAGVEPVVLPFGGTFDVPRR